MYYFIENQEHLYSTLIHIHTRILKIMGHTDGTMSQALHNTDPDITLASAFLACLLALAGLIFLVLIRYIFMVLAEIALFDRYANHPPSWIRILCPWYGRHQHSTTTTLPVVVGDRTVPSLLPTQQLDSMGIIRFPVSFRNDNGPPHTLPSFLLEELLPGRVLTEDDILEYTQNRRMIEVSSMNGEKVIGDGDDDNKNVESTPPTAISSDTLPPFDGSSSNNDNDPIRHSISNCLLICSICIHEITVNESAFAGEKCNHLYHTNCIQQWFGGASARAMIVVPNSNMNNTSSEQRHPHRYYPHRQQPQTSSQQQQQEIPSNITSNTISIQVNNDCPNCRIPLIQNLNARVSTILSTIDLNDIAPTDKLSSTSSS